MCACVCVVAHLIAEVSLAVLSERAPDTTLGSSSSDTPWGGEEGRGVEEEGSGREEEGGSGCERERGEGRRRGMKRGGEVTNIP